MTTNTYKLALLTLTCMAGTAIAGTSAKEIIKESPKTPDSWCSWLQDNPGTLYKNKKNPYIQELRIYGRFHWQYAYMDGEGFDGTGTRKFNYDTEEIRRFRLGAKIRFFKYYKAAASFNLENDLSPLGGSRDIEYASIYSATLAMNVKKAFDLSWADEFEFRIGKEKATNSAEGEPSSRFIKTVERSSLSNYVATPSSTCFFLTMTKGPWITDFGMYSGDLEREFTRFDNDFFYNLHTGYQFKKSDILGKSRIDLRLLVNGDEKKNSTHQEDQKNFGAINQKWVASLSTNTRKGRFNLLTDFIYGDNGTDYDFTRKGKPKNNPEREGSFWGIVILPSYWLVENKLEAVARYQYAHASKTEGFRINARYSRVAGEVYGFGAPGNDMSNGRGDRHHNGYLGLNYHLCGENAKIMLGIEYDDLNSGTRDIYEGTTVWTAFRMYF
jgi:hypothetical protein